MLCRRLAAHEDVKVKVDHHGLNGCVAGNANTLLPEWFDEVFVFVRTRRLVIALPRKCEDPGRVRTASPDSAWPAAQGPNNV